VETGQVWLQNYKNSQKKSKLAGGKINKTKQNALHGRGKKTKRPWRSFKTPQFTKKAYFSSLAGRGLSAAPSSLSL
jgi:hypothetical protein